MDNTKNTESTSGTAGSDAAAFMADLLQKLGGPAEAMKAFAMFTTMMGTTTPAATTTPPPPPVSEAERPQQEADLAGGLELLAENVPRLDSVVEGETSVLADISVGVSAGETPVDVISGIVASVSERETPAAEELGEEETPGVSTSVVGRETLDEFGGDEAQVSEKIVSEGGTPEKLVGTEAHEEQELVGVESPVYITGATPLMSEEGEALVADVVQDPVEDRVKLIVDLTDVPEGTFLPIDAREARRQARRSVLDDIDDSVQQTTREALGPGTAAEEQDNSPRPSGGGVTKKGAARRWTERERGSRSLLPRPSEQKGKLLKLPFLHLQKCLMLLSPIAPLGLVTLKKNLMRS